VRERERKNRKIRRSGRKTGDQKSRFDPSDPLSSFLIF